MRQTWIFQGFPGRFDMDAYLNTRPATLFWLVTSGRERIKVGDQVLLWKAVGRDDPKKSGIVAEAEVIAQPEIQLGSDASVSFWLSAEDREAAARTPELIVQLRLKRLANAKEVLRRDWLKEDPIAHNLTIIRRPTGTNFFVPTDHQVRLEALWAKAGTDWTYQECVAGLWAFQQTYGKEVSRTTGSPVSEVSIKIGRVVSGVYNKVMNFRALDPRDPRKGFSGGSENDSLVWRKFFDLKAGTVKSAELDAEYERLWLNASQIPSHISSAEEIKFSNDVSIQQQRNLAELRRDLENRRTTARNKPRTSLVSTLQFERDPMVVAYAKLRAGFRCEVPECHHPTFLVDDRNPYCEVHHIEFLSTGGEDEPDNVACLCPAHHREVHLGKNARFLKETLLAIRQSAKKPE